MLIPEICISPGIEEHEIAETDESRFKDGQSYDPISSLEHNECILSKPPHCLPVSQRRQKFSRRLSKFRVPHIGSNLNQRFENKPPILHRRMRNFQAWPIHHFISIQDHIDINLARAFIS